MARYIHIHIYIYIYLSTKSSNVAVPKSLGPPFFKNGGNALNAVFILHCDLVCRL